MQLRPVTAETAPAYPEYASSRRPSAGLIRKVTAFLSAAALITMGGWAFAEQARMAGRPRVPDPQVRPAGGVRPVQPPPANKPPPQAPQVVIPLNFVKPPPPQLIRMPGEAPPASPRHP